MCLPDCDVRDGIGRRRIWYPLFGILKIPLPFRNQRLNSPVRN